MQMWTETRSHNRLWTVAFAGLAICVFMWGLQYKLSLYVPSQANSHQVPIAKLLSPNERSESHQNFVYTQPHPMGEVLRDTAIAAMFVLTLLVLCLPESFRRHRANRVKQIRHALLEAFFVRPPPTLV
jgi:hypothetical protein